MMYNRPERNSAKFQKEWTRETFSADSNSNPTSYDTNQINMTVTFMEFNILLRVFLEYLLPPRTSIRGHVRWSVGRSVTQSFEMRKTADFDVFLHSYHLSCLTTFIFILSFIQSFIHQKRSSTNFLIKRGALIGLYF